MGWLIALGIIILLAILPLGVRILYNAEGLFVWICIGPIKLLWFPDTEEKDEEEKEKTKKTIYMAAGKQRKVNTENKTGGLLTDFIDIVKAYLMLLRLLRPKVRIKRLEMNLVMASDDPCDLAVNYGKAWAIVGNLIPLLESALVIKKRDIQVGCDFEASQTRIYARADIKIMLYRLIGVVFTYVYRLVKQYSNVKNSGKDGNKHEQ